MKKTILATVLATITTTANASPSVSHTRPFQNSSCYIYNTGYNKGKSDAYNNVARTVAIVGFVAIATVFVYKVGQESRWTGKILVLVRK